MAQILLAEDDTALCQMLALTLEKAGHSVTSAPDGLRAHEILVNTSENTPFDLLVTDIVMPGMDGVELSRKATRRFPALQVVFITGFSAVAPQSQGTEPSHNAVLTKPFHLNDLVTRIETLLATKKT